MSATLIAQEEPTKDITVQIIALTGATSSSIGLVRVIESHEVRPLRAAEYPVLGEIWSGDEDDDIFTDTPAV